MIYKGQNSKEWPKTCDSTPLLCPLDGWHAFFCKEHLSVVKSTSYSSARLDTLVKDGMEVGVYVSLYYVLDYL